MGKYPPRTSTKINDDVWFYQAAKSLQFVVWVKGRDGNRVATTFRVPWSKLARTFPARNAKPPHDGEEKT